MLASVESMTSGPRRAFSRKRLLGHDLGKGDSAMALPSEKADTLPLDRIRPASIRFAPSRLDFTRSAVMPIGLGRLGVFATLALLAGLGVLPFEHPLIGAAALAAGFLLAGAAASRRFVAKVPRRSLALAATDGPIVAAVVYAGGPSGRADLLLPLALLALATLPAVVPWRWRLAVIGWEFALFALAALLTGYPLSAIILTLVVSAFVAATLHSRAPSLAPVREPRVGDSTVEPSMGPEIEPEWERERLIAMLSHDLRTPLTSVKGFAQLLLRDSRLADVTRRYAEIIVAESNRAIRTIGDAVDLVQVQTGQGTLRLSLVDVGRVAANAVAQFDPEAERWPMNPAADASAENSRVRLRVRGPLPLVQADAIRVERIMVNLIASAQRYVGEDAAIAVSVSGDATGVTVWVQSDGREIPTARFAHIFDGADDASTERELNGSGLGLYIAKYLVEAHGGRMWVESMGGRGTTFAFRLKA
jgi:signal transduction histidine kinase